MSNKSIFIKYAKKILNEDLDLHGCLTGTCINCPIKKINIKKFEKENICFSNGCLERGKELKKYFNIDIPIDISGDCIQTKKIIKDYCNKNKNFIDIE